MKNIYAWLKMMNVGGDYPIPMSEESYNMNKNNIDVVLPTHGGKLQDDGTWLQESWKLNHDFAQGLKAQAHAAGQLYIPAVSSPGIVTVLDSQTLQEFAANNLVELATTGRFDSPWDGVWLDLEGIPDAYKLQLSQFLYLLSYKLRSAGLLVGVSVHAIVSDPGPDYDGAYPYDFPVVAQIADFVDIRCYGFWKPVTSVLQRSIAPYWWVNDCIEYALSQGIPQQRLGLGLGSYCKYYPNSNSNAGRVDITHEQALQLIDDAQSKDEWVEHDSNGLVRERLADLGSSHIWVHDHDTLRHGLDLVDKYDLSGAAIFVLGTEDPNMWDVIAEWKE